MSTLRKGTTVYAIIRAFYDHHVGRGRAVTLGELYMELGAFAGTALHQRITDARTRYGVGIVHERFKRDRDPEKLDLYYLDPDPEVIEDVRMLLEQTANNPRRLRTTTVAEKGPITPADSSSTPDPDGTEKIPASQPPAVPSESPFEKFVSEHKCDRCGAISVSYRIAGLDTPEREYEETDLSYVEGEKKTEILGVKEGADPYVDWLAGVASEPQRAGGVSPAAPFLSETPFHDTLVPPPGFPSIGPGRDRASCGLSGGFSRTIGGEE